LTPAFRPARWRLIAALAALLVAWVVAPGAVPLYDGINFPDEPYRYVVPPAGYQHTPRPDSATGTATAAGGVSTSTLYVNTEESAPQVDVVIPNTLLATSAGVTSFTVSTVPLAPDHQPSKGRIDGNVYRVSVVAMPSGTVSWAPPPGDAASESLVVLRATSAARPPPVFLYRASPGLAWSVLPTFIYGNDIYRAQFAGFGDYALAFGVVPPPKGSHVADYAFVAVLLMVVLFAAGVVIAVRRARRPA
jgi:hypothetical protein